MSGLRVLVCGGRDWCDILAMMQTMDGIRDERGPIAKLIHGAAAGADMEADCWAGLRDIPVEPYPASWRKYGRRAGPLRNERMLIEGKPDLVVAFPGGRGTEDMKRRARAAGIEVIEVSPTSPALGSAE